MKRKTRSIFSIAIVAAAFISLVSCRKNVPEGQVIKADGTVTEVTSKAGFAGVKIYLYGGHINSSNGTVLYGDKPLDSAVSDVAGHFSLQYRAEGNSIDYALSLDNNYLNGNLSLLYDLAIPFQMPFNFAHQLSNVAFTVNQTYALQLHLIINSVPNDSLYINFGSDYGFSNFSYFLHGQSVDTVLPARFVPDKVYYVLYRSYNNDTLIDGVNYHRELTDTLLINNRNNEQVEKHITSTNDFPLHIY